MHYPAQIQKPSAITISLKSVLILTLLLYVLKAIIIDTGVSDAASFLFKPVLAFQGTFPFYNNYNSPTIFANQPITNWIEQCISNNIAVNNKIGMVVPNGFAAYCIQQLQPSSYYQSQIRINLFRQC